MSKWIAALQDALIHERSEIIPEGFQTIRQIAKEIGLSRERTGHLVHKLLEQGRAERRLFRCPESLGRHVPYYRLKP